MNSLRKAKIEESEKILNFYQNIVYSIEGTQFKPKWSKYYPNLEFIKSSIEKQELYVYKKDSDIIGCVVLNNRFDPEYDNIDWIVEAKPEEIVIIHTFAVTSDLAGKGIGKEIFRQIKNNALKNNQKTIRLDIIDGNIGAQKVFEKFGFKYIDTVEIFHDIVGLEKFHLYEHILEK
ncbi:GNAT family N-acetyltransferase [Methanobrevibacter sp.]|uniref:GNAT family N-acetyltransferase n=1 Tax=Methanobrevibacter sp. TaxID=66852 RepID=UPI00388D4FE4